MAASQADFAATAPWKGIIGRPTGNTDNQVLVWNDATKEWVPITLAQLKALLAALP